MRSEANARPKVEIRLPDPIAATVRGRDDLAYPVRHRRDGPLAGQIREPDTRPAGQIGHDALVTLQPDVRLGCAPARGGMSPPVHRPGSRTPAHRQACARDRPRSLTAALFQTWCRSNRARASRIHEPQLHGILGVRERCLLCVTVGHRWGPASARPNVDLRWSSGPPEGGHHLCYAPLAGLKACTTPD